jgi:hypothetical protein
VAKKKFEKFVADDEIVSSALVGEQKKSSAKISSKYQGLAKIEFSFVPFLFLMQMFFQIQ